MQVARVSVLVLVLSVLGAGAAVAQETSTGGLRSGSGSGSVTAIDSGTAPPSGAYIPGMPTPPPDAGATGEAAGEEGGSKGGRISKITKVDRDAKITSPNLQVVSGDELYRGIVPGLRDWHLFPRKARDAARNNPSMKNRMSWIGFQPFKDGSRLFVQTIKPATYSVNDGSGADGFFEIRLSLIGTKVPKRNDRRSLDTSYFDTAVIDATARPSGADTVVTIRLQSKVGYKVTQEGEFLYVSFEDAGTTAFKATTADPKAP